MARPTKHRFATIAFRSIAWIIAVMVAICFLIPALMVNINWADGITAPWNLAAIGSVLGSALFIEFSTHARSWGRSALYVLLAVVFFLNNVQIAFTNASHRSDHRSDHRKTAMVAAKTGSSQRSQWSQGRTEAATVAGEQAPTTYQAEIDSLTSKEAGRWRASEECNPLEIKSQLTRDFCSAVSTLKAKKAAAERRDELDAKIAKLDEKTEKVEVVTSDDPSTDRTIAFLALIGITVSESTRTAIGSQKDLLQAAVLEALATFAPSAVMGLFSVLMQPKAPAAPVKAPVPEPKQRRRWWNRERHEKPDVAAKVEKAAVMPEEKPAVALDDPWHKFVSEVVEEAPGISTLAGELYTAYCAWCAKAGVSTLSQKRFGTMMGEKFAKDADSVRNRRPAYLNIRLKKAQPHLRVV